MASTLNKLGISALRGAYRIRPRLPCRPLVSQPCPFHTSSTRRNTGAPPPTKPSTIIDSQDVPDELDEDLVYNTQRAPRNAEEEAMLRRAEEQLTPEEKALLDQWKAKGEANAATAADRFLAEMGDDPPEAHEHFRPGLMAMGEVDEVDVGEDETFKGDDMTSLGHAELDQHREMREYARIAAWEMPLLSKFAKPYVPPTRDTPLRFRYTDYMGETHPAANKVVLQFCTADLPLQPAHRLKLVKLLGPRYNPQADLAHLSCEMFATQAQNKRYLGDLVDTLMAEARGDNDAPDSADPFADVPVDFRHVKWKARARFPDAWKVTATRRAELEAQWAGEEHTESERVADGAVVDGVRLIQAAARSFPAVDHVPVAVEVGRRRDRTTPRMR